MTKSVFLIMILFYALPAWSDEQNVIPLWTYYDFPPFSVDNAKEEGLSYDLGEYLNQKLKDRGASFRFDVVYLSRPRLNGLLEQNSIEGAVLWPTPSWFADIDQSIYIWTDPLLTDRNEVISLASKPVEYQSPDSLKGLLFGGVFGHKFIGITEKCESKELSCEFVYQEKQNLKKLIAERIDVLVLASTAAAYLTKNEVYGDKLYFSKTAHSTYQRRIMLTQGLSDHEDTLNEIIADLSEDTQWKNILANYGL